MFLTLPEVTKEMWRLLSGTHSTYTAVFEEYLHSYESFYVVHYELQEFSSPFLYTTCIINFHVNSFQNSFPDSTVFHVFTAISRDWQMKFLQYIQFYTEFHVEHRNRNKTQGKQRSRIAKVNTYIYLYTKVFWEKYRCILRNESGVWVIPTIYEFSLMNN